MKLQDIQIIGIVGSGTMGTGIAQVSALAEYDVIVYDLSDQALEKSAQILQKNIAKGVEKGKIAEEEADKALKRVSFTSNIEDVDCDLVIEAVVEKLDVKVEIFSKLHEVNGPNCVFASNTSSIPISRIASKIENPERVVGMHFFNPAHIMKLVEVISGASTSKEISDLIYELSLKLGKTPIHVKDSAGFVVNRVARHFYVESLKILEDGIADHDKIDGLIESYGFKMGPFRLMDLIGVDTNFSVTQSMYNAFHQDSKFRPSRIQENKVDAGHWGRKSGKGFYDYEK